MKPHILALLSAVIPFVTVHLTYLISADMGAVDWCFPYIDSCTSISATGRTPPASYVFKALMLPIAAVMMGFWWASAVWIKNLRSIQGNPIGIANTWMLSLGVLACVGLILYVTVLGEIGDVWRRQRRIGVVLFFSLTYIAQLLWLAQLRPLSLSSELSPAARVLRVMWFVCITLLTLGVLTVVFELVNEAWYDTVEDAFEWILALLLQLNFFLAWRVWRRMPWTLVVKPDG